MWKMRKLQKKLEKARRAVFLPFSTNGFHHPDFSEIKEVWAYRMALCCPLSPF